MSSADASFVARVLVVDDEESIRDSLRMILEHEGYQVEEAAGGGEALAKVAHRVPDAMLLDIKMPDVDGLTVLQSLREKGYLVPVIMITGHGDVQTAVDATQRGAFDFFEKPLQRDRVLLALRNAVESNRLARETRTAGTRLDDLVGSSPQMRELRATMAAAGPTPATVLIVGESGTGKELVAHGIHRLSTRKDKPFVQVNCAAIPDELIESELFGHEKGSFTGAVRKQVGKFVAADGGTIFLDEIGDMSPRTQAKVLRVLQSGEVERVGSEKMVRVDVRVIAATNRDLDEEISGARFREDLYYRLNVIPIRTPPLRERAGDVEELAEYFVRRYAETHSYPSKSLSEDAVESLGGLPWRGNVRELKNLIERLLILSGGDTITAEDVGRLTGGSTQEIPADLASAVTLKEFREKAERLFLVRKLEEFGWNVTRTAKAIATPRSNLYKKLEQYGIQRHDEEGVS
jgi:two-component system nitrogen regulation response regulator NtrX